MDKEQGVSAEGPSSVVAADETQQDIDHHTYSLLLPPYSFLLLAPYYFLLAPSSYLLLLVENGAKRFRVSTGGPDAFASRASGLS